MCYFQLQYIRNHLQKQISRIFLSFSIKMLFEKTFVPSHCMPRIPNLLNCYSQEHDQMNGLIRDAKSDASFIE